MRIVTYKIIIYFSVKRKYIILPLVPMAFFVEYKKYKKVLLLLSVENIIIIINV